MDQFNLYNKQHLAVTRMAPSSKASKAKLRQPKPGEFHFERKTQLVPGIDAMVCVAVAYWDWFARREQERREDERSSCEGT